MQLTNNPVDNTCKNGCIYAQKMQTMTSFKYEGEMTDQPFLWRCAKIDQIVTIDSIFHKLGCASFDNTKQNMVEAQAEELMKAVDQKLEEIAKVMTVATEAVTPIAGSTIESAVPDTDEPVSVPQNESAASPLPSPEPVVVSPITEHVTNGVPIHQVEVKEVPSVAKPAELPKKRGRKPKEHPVETPPAPAATPPPTQTEPVVESTVPPTVVPIVETPK